MAVSADPQCDFFSSFSRQTTFTLSGMITVRWVGAGSFCQPPYAQSLSLLQVPTLFSAWAAAEKIGLEVAAGRRPPRRTKLKSLQWALNAQHACMTYIHTNVNLRP
ncbi:hypothetical protein J3458_000834 [Metarhizium acridum]|uniref:uncharacterized protein n=1 Tax=Metarhizium acridum TaxID=92637 RepID=UPI001C6B496A|nr:hypothetical protein J3458_000834 [Metarhizium acridum]